MPQSLSPDAVAVRGGQSRDLAAVLRKLIDSTEDGNGPRLSIYCVERRESAVAQDVFRASTEGDIALGQVQVGSVERLLAAGPKKRSPAKQLVAHLGRK